MILKCGCETNDETKEMSKQCETHKQKEIPVPTPQNLPPAAQVTFGRRKEDKPTPKIPAYICPHCQDENDYTNVALEVGFYGAYKSICPSCGQKTGLRSKDKPFFGNRVKS